MPDFGKMTPAQLADAHAQSLARLEGLRAHLETIVEENRSIERLVEERGATDEASAQQLVTQRQQRQAQVSAAAQPFLVEEGKLEEIEEAARARGIHLPVRTARAPVEGAFNPMAPIEEPAAFDPMAPLPPEPAPPPVVVESVVADLGPSGRGPAGVDPRVLVAAGVLIAIVALVGLGLAMRGTPKSSASTAATSPAAAATTSSSTTAVAPPAGVTSGARARHSEGNIVPDGAGCTRPGSVRFLFRVTDANPGDAAVVTLTGPGMPPTFETRLSTTLEAIAEVPVPLHTSGKWTGRLSSIAGQPTNSSPAFEASTGLTC